MRARLLGTGAYVPRSPLPHRLSAPAPAEHRGRGRRAACPASEPIEDVADLALVAALETLSAARCEAREIDCVVLAHETPGCGTPGAAAVLGAKLGVAGAPAFDLHNPSGGFLYGLSLADHFVRLGTHARVLVAGAETRERPDGVADVEVGAALVAPATDDAQAILGAGLHADGRFARLPALPFDGDETPAVAAAGGGAVLAARPAGDVAADCYHLVRAALCEALAACRLTVGDVALFVLNRATAPFAGRLARDLGVSPHHVVAGAGPAARSIPVAFDGLVRGGGIRRGDAVVLCSFGPGFVWAWTVVRW